MNHTQAIREIMVLQNTTLAELGERLGMSHVGVLHRITSKQGRLDTILQILEELGYEAVVRPQTTKDPFEGEYIIRHRDYISTSLKKDDLL